MSAARHRTFVLVHGAWHGGWCWRRVADRLTAAGHRVFTPTLTGLGERKHLMSASITLDTHVQDVCNLIRFEELSDICLVGHSYAGMVVSLVAEAMEDRISSFVFLDAFVPEDGETPLDLVSARCRRASAPPSRAARSPALRRLRPISRCRRLRMWPGSIP